MPKKRFAAISPILALLSLGFLSHSPFPAASERWIAGAGINCVNCSESGVISPAAPISEPLARYLLASGAVSSSEHYAAFSRQLELQAQLASVNPLLIKGSPFFFRPLGFELPGFPSYALPSVARYQVNLVRPDSSKQIFGGLMSDPVLQYLIKPTAPAAERTVAAAMGAQEASATLGNVALAKTEAAPASAASPAGDLKKSPQIQTSSLLGGVPVPKVSQPQISFSKSK